MQRALFSNDYESFNIDNQQTIYIVQENTTAITRGVAVMIGESGTPIISQQGLAPLADQLNKLGWVTLLLPAPDDIFNPSDNPPPATEETPAEEPVAEETSQNTPTEESLVSENNTDSDLNTSAVSTLDVDAFAQHENKLVSLLQASQGKAEEYPGFFLVIAQGTSAAWMAKIYAEKTLDMPDAFVAISPFWPDRQFNQMLPAFIANTPMPVLDLYSDNDNEWALTTVSHREISAVKALKLQYRQRELLGYKLPENNSLYLSKEIYGWISYMGW